VSGAESDAYFAQRPVENRIGVYASRQGEPIESRKALDDLYDQAAERFKDGIVPRPDWWGGYRVVPDAFEFWQGRIGRLHDRLQYEREAAGWRRQRLAP
jgi:pyridoxamine 5'-phosphate oxidase